MANYTAGSMRVVLQQPDLTTYQGNGSVVLDSQLARPLWFDGRFLAASDLEREQNYFLQRQANLGRAGGFGVMHGLLVDQGTSSGQPATAETIVIHAGDGITPAGELVMLPSDLTIQLSRSHRRRKPERAVRAVHDAAATSAHAHGAVRAGAAAGGVHGQPDHLIPNQYPGTAHDA